MTDRSRENISRSAHRDPGCRVVRGVVQYALFVALVTAMNAAACADEPASVEQFNAQSRNWSRLADTGVPLTLEGRCTALSPSERRLLMTRCELIFEIADNVVIPGIKPPNVVVTGQLEQRGQRFAFVVTTLRTRPADIDQLKADRGRIDVNRPDQWYELARWAQGRAEFYKDEELDDAAIDLYRQGVQAEYRRLPADDTAGLVALAEKTGRLGLSDRLRMQFLHEAVSRELESAQSNDGRGFDTVMTHAREWLPGARTPLLEFNDEVREQQAAYIEARPDTYAEAEDQERPVLERFLYIAAALGKIEGEADADGRNGFEIAQRIDASIPELDELAETYRLREIRWQLSQASQLKREQLLVLVDRLEDRNREAEGIDVRRAWLVAQAERLNRAGVSGRLELAEEYLELLGDEATAADIYRDLYRSAESQRIAANRLQELGYTFDGEEWRTGDAPSETDELSEAIRSGSVRTGMSEADVRAALGMPESTLRFASRGQVVELWVYPGPGISIHFARRRASEEQIAVEVFNLPARTRERLRP